MAGNGVDSCALGEWLERAECGTVALCGAAVMGVVCS